MVSEQDRIELNALVDGEFDAARAAALEMRLLADAELRGAHEEILAARAAARSVAKPELSAEFLGRIDRLASRPVAARGALARRQRWFGGWQSLAASLLLTAFAASGVTYVLTPRALSIEESIASDHRRSLLAASPVDVLSSDRHTVKPWLDARLGISPPAPDLAAQGFPLVGGRVEVLAQTVAPVLVYRHNEHTLSLVALPGPTATAAPRNLAAGGYNMVEWRADGFAFTAVSDLEPDELASFVSAYRTAAGGP